MRLFVFVLLTTAVALLLSCGDDEKPTPKSASEDSTIVAYLDSLAVSDYQVTEEGIYYFPSQLNPTGRTQDQGNVLSMYYTLSILDGQTLITHDSSDGEPIRVKQGVNAIYPIGIDHSLSVMKQGEQWTFVIPSALGYVNYSSSLIPENAILIFEATLDSIQNEMDIRGQDNQKIVTAVDSLMLTDTLQYPNGEPRFLTSGVLYQRLTYGDTLNVQRPATGNEVTITYTGWSGWENYRDNVPFDQQYAGGANPFTYTFNQNIVISGLDAGIGEMILGERALLIIPSLMGYRESAMVLPAYLTQEMVDMEIVPDYAVKVGAYEVLIFEVTLQAIN